MTKEELLSIERNLWAEYSKKLNDANAEFVKNSEIQVEILLFLRSHPTMGAWIEICSYLSTHLP